MVNFEHARNPVKPSAALATFEGYTPSSQCDAMLNVDGAWPRCSRVHALARLMVQGS